MGVHSRAAKYFDRELSWLEFNQRVLSEAMDETNPLLERLKFIGIVSSNLDEFFMVRIASLNESDAIYARVYARAFEQMLQQNRYFLDVLVPSLKEHGLERRDKATVSDKEYEYVDNLFRNEILSLLTPIAMRPDYTIPSLGNLSLYRIFELRDPQKSRQSLYSVVEMPKSYSRMVSLPVRDGFVFIMIEDIVSLFAKDLFQGYDVIDQGLLRITRASEMTLDEEKDEDFAKVMTAALRARRQSYFVRIEFQGSAQMRHVIQKRLKTPELKMIHHDGWFDLAAISQLASHPGFETLKRPQWRPVFLPEFEESSNLWDVIKKKDILVHHPYESFDMFVRFISEAALDPNVLAIKHILYRTNKDSTVIAALEKAAESGKQVTVLVELKARFDEARNIGWAQRLEDAGATVLYGVAGLKTHVKACLVMRREPEGIQRYVHLGTGNYNERTAEIYSDLGVFTAQDEVCGDIASLFNVITGYSQPIGFAKIVMAPYGFRKKILRLIERETMLSRKEKPGQIMAKMNSLVDHEIIDALYKASQAGVQIHLNIRGICCLCPGIKGLSDTIEVVSIVDMFLEHSRIFYFQNDGDDDVCLSSADWMPRNLDKRVEIMFPVDDFENKAMVKEILETYFRDTEKSWCLQPSGQYIKKERGKHSFRAQTHFCAMARAKENVVRKTILKDLKPLKAQ